MEEKPISKVSLDHTGDFKFRAAYEAYSRCFDNASVDDAKNSLNSLITKLFGSEITYGEFYNQINQYREGANEGHEFLKTRIEGKRKRDAQRDERKLESIKRHKK